MQEKINKMLRAKVELLEVQVKELQEKVMNKYQEALEKIKNEYDAFFFENKYGTNTHQAEFCTLMELGGSNVESVVEWIKNNYDCHYKDEVLSEENNPFAYLERIAQKGEICKKK